VRKDNCLTDSPTPGRAVYAAPQVVEDVAACDFYHTMDVPGHGYVQGQWDLREGLNEYLGRVDFARKRVLETGTADGFITFELERRGAEVVSYDLSDGYRWDVVPYARRPDDSTRSSDDGYWLSTEERFKEGIRRLNNAYWFCHRAHGSKARMVHGTIYNVPAEIGAVDIVTFGAILLHTRDPFAALASPLRLDPTTVIVTEPRDRLSLPPALRRLRNILPQRLRRPVMRFLPDWRTARDPDGWWSLSPELVVAFLGVLGFERTEVIHHTQPYKGRPRPMFTVVGHRTG
jgi:hypothetical protein